MDAATLALIKRFEGSKPVGWDYKQYSGPYGVKIAPGERIDLGEAERRLQAEVAPIGGHLDKAFGGVTMTPQQRSALTSFTYNVGPGWMSSPTRLASAVRSGDWNSAASVMREYNKAGGKVLPGLVNRRDQEARMLLGGPMPEAGAQPEPGLPPLSMKSFVGQAGAETPAPVPRETPPAPSMLGAPPMAEPEQSPFNSFIERFQSPMTQQGLGLLMAAMQGGDLNAGATAGAQRGNMALQQYLAIQKQRQEQQKRQQIEQMIGGMTDIPEQARNFARVTGDTGVIEKYLTAQAGGGQTADIKEYEYARKNGFQGSLQDWLVSKRASQGEYAKQPTYGVDQDGNPVLLQLGTRGDAVPTKLPEGVRMQRDPIKMDAGTKYILLDPTTRQVIGEVPKNLAQTEIDKGEGQAIAKAREAMPGAESSVYTALDTLRQLEEHPGMKYGVGALGVLPGIPGTEQKGFVKLFDQAKATAFLDAFEALKGAGAITETEGRVATDARNRMDRATNEKDFRKALDDYRGVIKRGQITLRKRAGVADDGMGGKRTAEPTQPAAPGGFSIRRLD